MAAPIPSLPEEKRVRRYRLFLLSMLVACTQTTTDVSRRFPVLDDVGQGDWVTVAVGGDHTCATKTTATAYCWGSNKFGQLGTAQGDTVCGGKDARFACLLVPFPVETTVRFRSLSAGATHTCGVTDTGEAYCWGANSEGQLGDLSRGGPTLIRVP